MQRNNYNLKYLLLNGIWGNHACSPCLHSSKSYNFCTTHCVFMMASSTMPSKHKFTKLINLVQEVE